MIKNGYYPKKLIYLGDNTNKALLVSSPDEYVSVIVEAIELGESAFADKYKQVALACGVELVCADDIRIIEE